MVYCCKFEQLLVSAASSMCDFCEERCCFFPLRWTSFGIGVLELLVFACVTVISYFTLPDSDLGKSHTAVQYGLQAIAFVCGLFLLLGALTVSRVTVCPSALFDISWSESASFLCKTWLMTNHSLH